MPETINIAPTASTVVRMYEEARWPSDATYAIAVLAVSVGRGMYTIDRLTATLNIGDIHITTKPV